MPQQGADHYAVLGVAPSASPQAVRQAYREQAKVQHPDKGGSATEFQRLQEAYEVLSNAGTREVYDAAQRDAATARRRQATRARAAAHEERRLAAAREQRMAQLRKAKAAMARMDRAMAEADSRWETTASGATRFAPRGSSRQGPRARRGRPGRGARQGRGGVTARTAAAAGERPGGTTPAAPRRAGSGQSPRAVQMKRQTEQQAQSRPGRAAAEQPTAVAPASLASIYAGVTGIDLAKPPGPAGLGSQQGGLRTPPQPAAAAAVFSARGSRFYHRRHDCRELRTAPTITAGPEERFLLERKVACQHCLGQHMPPLRKATGLGTGGLGSKHAGSTSARYGARTEPLTMDDEIAAWIRRARQQHPAAAAAVAAAQVT
jgi:curved DNA-binding protein CbpA